MSQAEVISVECSTELWEKALTDEKLQETNIDPGNLCVWLSHPVPPHLWGSISRASGLLGSRGRGGFRTTWMMFEFVQGRVPGRKEMAQHSSVAQNASPWGPGALSPATDQLSPPHQGALALWTGGGPAQKECEFTQGSGLEISGRTWEGRHPQGRAARGMLSVVALGLNPLFLLEAIGSWGVWINNNNSDSGCDSDKAADTLGALAASGEDPPQPMELPLSRGSTSGAASSCSPQDAGVTVTPAVHPRSWASETLRPSHSILGTFLLCNVQWPPIYYDIDLNATISFFCYQILTHLSWSWKIVEPPPWTRQCDLVNGTLQMWLS